MLLTALPFLLRFLGEGAIGRYLSYRKDMLASANEAERIRLNAEISKGEHELKRREMQRDLQLKELEHPLMWWPKFLLMMFVCLYWAARFFVKFTGLNDYNVAVADLNEVEAAVSGAVLAYMFIGEKVASVFRR